MCSAAHPDIDVSFTEILQSLILEFFPLYFFALNFSFLNMAHHIDWGKGKSFEFFMPHMRSDFYGLLIFGQKYGLWWIIYRSHKSIDLLHDLNGYL